jgi:hypothetical protein
MASTVLSGNDRLRKGLTSATINAKVESPLLMNKKFVYIIIHFISLYLFFSKVIFLLHNIYTHIYVIRMRLKDNMKGIIYVKFNTDDR